MTVNDNLSIFLDKKIEDYDSKKGIQNPATITYRIRIDYDEYDNKVKITDKIEAFVNDPAAKQVEALVIGAFDFEMSDDSSPIINMLVDQKDKLPQLKAIFIGDITYQECEISWIKQSDISPLLEAYPNLEYLQVRGSDGLEFSSLQHAKLKTLIVESGGLPPNVIDAVSNASLPALEKLDLWLGDDGYGFESSINDLGPIISGEKFPNLQYLGLKDSIIQDEIAEAVAASPVLNKLHTLDLSMGNLSDAGGEALLKSDGIKKLKFLNLRHHYLSDAMMSQLHNLGIAMNLDGQENGDEDDRYIEVSE